MRNRTATAKWTPCSSTIELREKCPAAYAETPHADVSNRYVFVSTLKIVQALLGLGWRLFECATVNGGTGFHAIKFFHPDFKTQSGDQLQIILMNSHDRSRRFSLHVGVFRFVCTNGLVVPTLNLGEFKRQHLNFDPIDLLAELLDHIKTVEQTGRLIRRMEEKILLKNDARKLAYECLVARLGEEKAAKVDLDRILQPVRPEDKKEDLYTTFNVVQERVLLGDFYYENERGKQVKARAIKSFKTNFTLNSAMMEAALAYVN
jgi:hypothetical protein